MALTVASTAVSFVGQMRQANSQEDAIRTNEELMLGDLDAKSTEVDGSAGAEKSDIAIEALRKKGQTRVASGENLNMGITAMLLQQDVYTQAGRESTKVEVNRQRSQEQIERDKRGVRARSQGAVNSIDRPSVLGTGLQIAGQVAGGMANKSTKKKSDGSKAWTTGATQSSSWG